jgi:hypothetical protein
MTISAYCFNWFNKDTINTVQPKDNQIDIESQTTIMDNSNADLISPLTNKDFIIIDDDTYIELGGKYNDLETRDNIINMRLANENFAYDVYVYDSFKITTKQGGQDGSIILSINLTTSRYQTSRGIRVGDNLSEAEEKYGNPDDSGITEIRGHHRYYYDDRILTFYTNDNKIITVISYEYL